MTAKCRIPLPRPTSFSFGIKISMNFETYRVSSRKVSRSRDVSCSTESIVVGFAVGVLNGFADGDNVGLVVVESKCEQSMISPYSSFSLLHLTTAVIGLFVGLRVGLLWWQTNFVTILEMFELHFSSKYFSLELIFCK